MARKKIAPSILSADFARLAESIAAVEAAGADWIHVDVMDGMFVPNITIGPPVVSAVRKVTELPLDVHLMIDAPDRYIKDFADAGADWIVVHAEACRHLHRTLQVIRSFGKKCGVALNPATPLCMIENLLADMDLLLLMTVNPGFGGQKHIETTHGKIEEARMMIEAAGTDVLIEVDGGVDTGNIGLLAELGVEVFVAGSAIFGADDMTATIAEMKQQAGFNEK